MDYLEDDNLGEDAPDPNTMVLLQRMMTSLKPRNWTLPRLAPSMVAAKHGMLGT
jgi:hypothetical protein